VNDKGSGDMWRSEVAEMKQDPTATPQVMSKTAQEFEESDISKSILQPRTADARIHVTWVDEVV
jgi:hypothetical protein